MGVRLPLVILMLAACSDDKPSVAVTAGNICEQVAMVACYDMYRCCDDSQIEAQLGTTSVPTQDACAGSVRDACAANPDLAKFSDSVANQHMTFDASVVNACLHALLEPGSTCVISGIPPWVSACMASAWTGTVPSGAPCAYDRECANAEDYCGTAMLVCVPKPHQGQPCNPGGCTPGTYCAGSTCMNLTSINGPCATDPQCGPGNHCASDGSCQPIPVTTTTDYCEAASVSTTQID